MLNTDQKVTADLLFAQMVGGWMAGGHALPDDATATSFAEKSVDWARLLTAVAKARK